MTHSVVVELHPAFRALTAQLRAFRPVIAFSVGHFDYDIAMLESGRTGALQFVILFSPRDAAAQTNDVRIVFAAVGDDQVSIAVRGPRGGKTIGTYRLAQLATGALQGVLHAATQEATERVRALAATKARAPLWQAWRA
ncbi:MAG: hypothetical protein WDO24_27955 [Pseudomonadota bacterium]